MKFIFVLIILLISEVSIYSKPYDGKVVLLNKEVIEARNIELNDTTVTYTSYHNKTTKSIPKSDVRLLQLKKGTYITEGLLFGAIGGAALYFSLPVFLNYERDYFSYYCVGGLVLGTVIGYSTYKIETKIINRKVKTSFLDNSKYLPYTNLTHHSLVRLQVSF